MAATDTAGGAASSLEPHQLAAYLAPPSRQQQINYVVEHCNYILPQLASDSLTASLASQPNLSSKSTPLFTTLPSSSALEAYLAELTSAHQQASARTANLESQLRNQLLSSLSGVKILKEKLSSLPDDIASTEDKLLDLCEDLVIAGASSSTTSTSPGSSRDGADTLIDRLGQLHTAIDQLKKAKQYFSILAQAEDLRLAVVKSDQDQAQRDRALQHLSELDALVRKVEKLSVVGSEQHQAAQDEPKLVAFLRAQRSAAFKALRKARCSRLSEAIAQTGWSHAKADLSTSKDDASNGLDSTAAKLVESTQVKQAWADVCRLQDVAEHLGLLRRATAKVSSQSSAQATDAEVVTAGSDAYQPLLTTQCLIEPMLLRFRYHFDGDRSTNRLDKPEWSLSHIASLIRSQAPLFLPAEHGVPGSGGAVVRLNRAYANASPSRRAYRHIDTYAELLHGLLTPLRRKLASTMPSLLDHPSLLAHTVFQSLTFDADLCSTFPPSLTVLHSAGTRKLSDDILDNPLWFNRWLDGEKQFALRRFEEIIDAPDAWAIGSSDSLADDDTFFPSSSETGQRTTKSARSTMEILDAVSERYRPLPSLSQRLSFLAIVQLPILRSYAQRLTRSLDAFESLSSAFARAMPGEIVATSTGQGDSDMVRGLRGLGRLVKALLSAQWVCTELERWSDSAAFVEMSEALGSTEEERALALGLRKEEGVQEDKELDAASLGMLLRRGLKRGVGVARPLAAGSPNLASDTVGTPQVSDVGQKQVLNEFGRYGVWEEPRRKFGEIASRAVTAIERLVVSETLEQLRPYVLRRWDQEDATSEDEEPYPTPTLIPALSVFSSHLGHLCSILERETLLPVYRNVSASIAGALVDRVVMAGGSRRFNHQGGVRFDRDLREGWLGVVREVGEANVAGLLGRRPEASWKIALDAASLLRLPSSTSGEGDKDGVKLAKAVQIVFDATDEGGAKGEDYRGLLEGLGVDDGKVNVREVLRRRVEAASQPFVALHHHAFPVVERVTDGLAVLRQSTHHVVARTGHAEHDHHHACRAQSERVKVSVQKLVYDDRRTLNGTASTSYTSTIHHPNPIPLTRHPLEAWQREMDISLSSDALDLSFHPAEDTNLVAVGLISGKIQLVNYDDFVNQPSSSRTPQPPSKRHKHSSSSIKGEEDEGKKIKLYKKLWVTRPSKKTCRGLSFNPTGERLFSISKDKSLFSIDCSTGKVVDSWVDAHEAAPSRVLPVDQLVVTGDDDGVVRLWDPRKGGGKGVKPVRMWDHHFDWITDMVYLADLPVPKVAKGKKGEGRKSKSQLKKDRKRAREAAALKQRDSSDDEGESGSESDSSSDEGRGKGPSRSRLIVTSGDGSLSSIDLTSSGPTSFELSEDQEDELLSITSIRSSSKLVVGTQLGILSLWSPSRGLLDHVDRVPGHPASVDTLVTLDSETVLTGSSDGLVRVVQILPSKLLGVIASHDGLPVERMRRKGNVLGSVGHSNCVKLTDLRPLLEEDEEGEEEEGALGIVGLGDEDDSDDEEEEDDAEEEEDDDFAGLQTVEDGEDDDDDDDDAADEQDIEADSDDDDDDDDVPSKKAGKGGFFSDL